jgi:hypothetical protein
VSAIDPRLAPVLASQRSTDRSAAAFGFVFLGVTAAFLGGLATKKDPKVGEIALIIGCALLFLVPGILLIRSWLRGPEVSFMIRLLTADRAKITAWDMEYVSINHGPTQTRIKLYVGGGRYHSIELPPDSAKPVLEYVTELAPRREK